MANLKGELMKYGIGDRVKVAFPANEPFPSGEAVVVECVQEGVSWYRVAVLPEDAEFCSGSPDRTYQLTDSQIVGLVGQQSTGS